MSLSVPGTPYAVKSQYGAVKFGNTATIVTNLGNMTTNAAIARNAITSNSQLQGTTNTAAGLVAW